ncbi:TetR/AcrR family transcriptional regulator [Kitasatospora viridis]|uniref:TetR family transcriptional regulator n=1 Tax=Kitasatospora viridis TaxID=281105 RepID=A0A561SDS0_9ACTN|nr:TetR family transcriptional regulator [Kitasatospora viridis]TWF72988.1 TetR family transcriptional regulator [Kitasatospora viridis]
MAHVPASERRPQLVRAAIDLMTREGVGAGSTRAIAAELGVAQATVHYTFGTKKDLYRAVVEELTAQVVCQVAAAAPDHGPFAEQVRTLGYALWQALTSAPDRFALCQELTSLSLRDPELREIMRELQYDLERTATGMITSLAEQHGVELAMPAEQVAPLFLAGIDGLMTRYLVLRQDGQDPGEETLPLLDALVNGVMSVCLGV